MVKNKSKRKPKNQPTSQKYKFYKMDGEILRRERNCPRCGPGIFLMKADNRMYCGKCHWTEFTGKAKPQDEPVKEAKPAKKK